MGLEPLNPPDKGTEMINFIKEYTDLFIFLCWLGTFVTGYFYGHHVGHSLGFTRGRIAGRKHPSLRNEQR
jgi:hypothetical protein